MRQVLLVAHFLGFVLWMGGAFAAMTVGLAARREDRAVLGALVRLQGSVYRFLITPGALLSVISGLILTLRLSAVMQAMSPWLFVMQGAGLLAGALTLGLIVPTAARLTRLDPEGQRDLFIALRQRQMRLGMVSGLLGLLALVAGAMLR